MFGYQKRDESGEEENIPRLSHNIKSFYDKQIKKYNVFFTEQKEKYDELFKRIEAELSSGATSINLSKSFADKVKEYNKSSFWWSIAFMSLVAGTIIYYGFVTFSTTEIKNIKDVFLHLYFRFPFLAFIIWLGIFLGNRRAESKKLEESYKHKEVLARSFTGYKKALEDINDTDKELLKEHMNNLLKTINKDSSIFLGSKGEKFSILEYLKKEKAKSDIKE